MGDLSPSRVLGRKRRAKAAGGRAASGGRRVTVDVSADELAVLEAWAAEAGGVSLQTVLMERALSSSGETPVERRAVLRELFALRRDLSGMAVNLNQAARRANAGDGFPVEVVRADLVELRRLAGPGGRIDGVIDTVASGGAV